MIKKKRIFRNAQFLNVIYARHDWHIILELACIRQSNEWQHYNAANEYNGNM